MKKRRSRLDEMQEQKLLHIEHNACWFAFYGLAVMMMAEGFYYGPEQLFDKAMGEFVIFLCMAFYIMAGCIREGIWDRTLKPSARVNVCGSLIAGAVGGFLRFMFVRRAGQEWRVCAGEGVRAGISIFILYGYVVNRTCGVPGSDGAYGSGGGT